MITATSTVESVSQGTANAQPKWVWHLVCATQDGVEPSVRVWKQSVPELIRVYFGLESLTRFGLGRASHPE